VAKLLEAIQRIVLEPGRMRALGFCVSKEHARYMARKFSDAGLMSIALTGDDSPEVRDHGLSALKAGELRCVFSVEVLGEALTSPMSTPSFCCDRPSQQRYSRSSSAADSGGRRERAASLSST